MKSWAKQTGFTIVELLIVIVVIAILAAISIVVYSGIQNRSKTNSGSALASSIVKKIEVYRTINGQYPTYPQLVNNYALGSTTTGTGGAEAKLESANLVVNAGLGISSARDGKTVQYNDCETSHPNRSVVYWNYQTNSPVGYRTFETC